MIVDNRLHTFAIENGAAAPGEPNRLLTTLAEMMFDKLMTESGPFPNRLFVKLADMRLQMFRTDKGAGAIRGSPRRLFVTLLSYFELSDAKLVDIFGIENGQFPTELPKRLPCKLAVKILEMFKTEYGAFPVVTFPNRLLCRLAVIMLLRLMTE